MKSSDEIDKDVKGYSERYIRWQGIRINQMGFINNLFMGLAVGSLIWLGNYLLTKENSANTLYLLSSVFFATSLLLGFLTAWNRLKDFRTTAQINRSLVEEPSAIAVPETKSKRRRMRTDAANLGEVSWKSLKWQVIHFVLGLILAAAAVAGTIL